MKTTKSNNLNISPKQHFTSSDFKEDSGTYIMLLGLLCHQKQNDIRLKVSSQRIHPHLMYRQQVPYSNKQLQKCTALKLILMVPSMIFPLPQLLLLLAKGTAILHKAEETPEIFT